MVIINNFVVIFVIGIFVVLVKKEKYKVVLIGFMSYIIYFIVFNIMLILLG